MRTRISEENELTRVRGSAGLQKAMERMDSSIQPLALIRSVAGVSPPVNKVGAVAGTGFKDAILQALQATSDLQKESGRLSREFSLDNPAVSLENTMLVGVKSGTAFQATLQVRNKVVQAYTDIMNMQV